MDRYGVSCKTGGSDLDEEAAPEGEAQVAMWCVDASIADRL